MPRSLQEVRQQLAQNEVIWQRVTADIDEALTEAVNNGKTTVYVESLSEPMVSRIIGEYLRLGWVLNYEKAYDQMDQPKFIVKPKEPFDWTDSGE